MKTLLFLLLIVNLGCKVNNNTMEEEKLVQILQNYYQTMSDRNWEKYQEFFWKDATLCTIWSSDGEKEAEVDVFTIQEFLNKTAEGPDSQPIFEEKMENYEITIQGNLATAWVKYSAKFGTENSLMEWSGIDLFSLVQYNNEWKIVNLSYASE